MNKRRLAAIARWLEAGAPEKGKVAGFSMEDWGDPNNGGKKKGCGTVCCIAGTAISWWGKFSGMGGYENLAGEILGIPEEQRWELFIPGDELSQIGPDWAARCIRKLIATGVVDWKGTRE